MLTSIYAVSSLIVLLVGIAVYSGLDTILAMSVFYLYILSRRA